MLKATIGGRSKRLYFALTVVPLASFLLPAAGFAFICCSIALKIRGKLSYFEKLFFTLITFLVVNAFLYEVFTLVSFHPDIRLIGFLYGIVGSLAFLALPTHIHSSIINKRFVICLVAAIAVFIGTIYPIAFTKSAHLSHTVATIHLLSSGEDNASHYALFKYAYANDGYSYGSSMKETGLIESLVNYPQGSEFSMAWVAKSVLGSAYESNDKILSLAYFTTSALAYALLAFITIIMGLLFYERAGARLKLPHATLATVIVFGGLAMGPALGLLGRGFQSQIIAYIFFMALVAASSKLFADSGFKIRLAFVLLSFGGVCISWWFLAPIAAVPLLIFLYSDRLAAKDLVQHTPLHLVWIISVLLLSVYPVCRNLLSGATNSGSINQPGGVDGIAATTMIFYGTACALVIILLGWRKAYDKFDTLIGALIGWAGFTLLVGVYQYMSIHHFSYYYYKSLYTLAPLSIVLAIYLAMTLADKVTVNLSRLQQVVLSLFIILAFVTYLFSIKPVYARVYVNDWYNNVITSDEISATLNALHGPYKDMIYVGGCADGATYISNRWTGATFLSENVWHRKIENAALYGKSSELASLLSNTPYGKSDLYIYAKVDCLNPSLQKAVIQSGYPSNLKTEE